MEQKSCTESSFGNISEKLEEVISQLQNPNFEGSLLKSSLQVTQFIKSLQTNATLLMKLVGKLIDNLQLSEQFTVEVQNVDEVDFGIHSKGVNNPSTIMQRDRLCDNLAEQANSFDLTENSTENTGKDATNSKLGHSTEQEDEKIHVLKNSSSCVIDGSDGSSNLTKLRNRKFKQFDCSLCNKKFAKASMLNTHLELEHNVKSEKKTKVSSSKEVCYLCGKIMANRTSLKRHLKWHQNDRPFKCAECGKMFITKAQLDNHSAGHSELLPFICDLCGAGFRCKYNLSVHGRRHNEERPYSCHICGKAFKIAGELKSHQLIHTQRKDHPCTTCGKTFFTKSKLDRHISTHTGDKPHQCSVCSKKFITYDMLRRHERIHTNELPHTCTYCGRKFRDKSNCNKHLKCCKSKPQDNEQLEALN